MSSVFAAVPLAPRDPILGLTEAFVADPNPAKVNLGVGVYQNAEGKLPLLDCVRLAEQQLAADPKPRGYLPINGLAGYDAAVKQLAFGTDPALLDRVITMQALGGTGALRIGADLLRQFDPQAKVLISNPSWENHQALFTRAGFTVESYRYYDPEANGVDVEGMLADLSAATSGTIVVLHACCHNPTGYDLTEPQWTRVLQTVRSAGLIPFLDMAYQGFSQSLEADGAVVRRFAESGLPVLVSTSFSKSLSLYGERVGALSLVCADADEAARVLSQGKIVIRTNFSNPPTHGAQIAATVLDDPALRELWVTELGAMRDRIKAMRLRLVSGLEAAGITDMGFIATQIGMFSYSGLTKPQMVALRDHHGVYGTDKGRICVAALNDANLDYVCRAIAAVRAE
ncbi:MAG: aspartate/tyrosine/aromatic aminotransferase [Micropruina sp.]|nr:aspartate/tyrosine/aromatic aminotransferase [Micropruina sp.]